MNRITKDQDLNVSRHSSNEMFAEAISFKPILFSTAMVEAIEAGRKTQTRRILKGISDCTNTHRLYTEADWNNENPEFVCRDGLWFCKYCGNGCTPNGRGIKPKYEVGDILWVREKWRKNDTLTGFPYHHYADNTIYTNRDNEKWKPSLFMPKEGCRIFLKVTDIRVEQLQDITHEDAVDEGVEYIDIEEPFTIGYKLYGKHRIPDLMGRKAVTGTAIESYQTLWESINGQDSWDENPFVWAVSFELTERPKGFC